MESSYGSTITVKHFLNTRLKAKPAMYKGALYDAYPVYVRICVKRQVNALPSSTREYAIPKYFSVYKRDRASVLATELNLFQKLIEEENPHDSSEFSLADVVKRASKKISPVIQSFMADGQLENSQWPNKEVKQTPKRELYNLTFDELCQLFTINFEYQPNQNAIAIHMDKRGCIIHDGQYMLLMDWVNGDLELGAIDNIQQPLLGSPEALLDLERTLTVSKTNKIRDQLTAFNMAFS